MERHRCQDVGASSSQNWLSNNRIKSRLMIRLGQLCVKQRLSGSLQCSISTLIQIQIFIWTCWGCLFERLSLLPLTPGWSVFLSHYRPQRSWISSPCLTWFTSPPTTHPPNHSLLRRAANLNPKASMTPDAGLAAGNSVGHTVCNVTRFPKNRPLKFYCNSFHLFCTW